LVKEKVTIQNKYGIHTRPATVLVEKASNFDAKISLIYKGDRANAKSILGILVLAVEPGAEVEIEAEGPDEEQAVAELVDLINNKFGTE